MLGYPFHEYILGLAPSYEMELPLPLSLFHAGGKMKVTRLQVNLINSVYFVLLAFNQNKYQAVARQGRITKLKYSLYKMLPSRPHMRTTSGCGAESLCSPKPASCR